MLRCPSPVIEKGSETQHRAQRSERGSKGELRRPLKHGCNCLWTGRGPVIHQEISLSHSSLLFLSKPHYSPLTFDKVSSALGSNMALLQKKYKLVAFCLASLQVPYIYNQNIKVRISISRSAVFLFWLFFHPSLKLVDDLAGFSAVCKLNLSNV